MLSICQRGGLANRLLTILSHAQAERLQGRSVLVFWPDSRDFPGTYEECFRPIEGIITLSIHPPYEYADVKEPSIKERMGAMKTYDYKTHWWGKECQWVPILSELLPSDAVRAMLPDVVYDAVHIRRTDLDQLIEEHGWGPQTPEWEYDKFIEESDAEFVWLACDNPDTQQRMRDRHGDKLRYVDVMKHTDDYTYWDGKVRHTSGVWTAADMFACAGARRFMGSRHSSLSALIGMLREPSGRWGCGQERHAANDGSGATTG